MSGVMSQRREIEALDESNAGQSRVTPVVPAPRWLRAVGDEPATSCDTQDDADENQFWDTPPRYSLTDLASLAPAPITQTRSRWHVFGARALFGTICCAVVVLLVLEVRLFSERMSLASTRSTSSLLSPTP